MKNISPCCLTIAGSDSGGNAGVQADLRAFHAYGVHGCTVFAALTAQNPFGVSAIHPVPADFVSAQLDAVLGVYNIKALKTGMLSDPVAIERIADRLKAHPEIKKVIDPVMIATSGVRLVDDASVAAIKRHLLPLATLITPNLPEAESLVFDGEGESLRLRRGRSGDVVYARELAAALYGKYGAAALVKGGHGVNDGAVDVFFDGKTYSEFAAPWIDQPISTHGTGCSLAAALAAELALGHDLAAAVRGAKGYVHQAIAASYFVGRDCGVLGFVKVC